MISSFLNLKATLLTIILVEISLTFSITSKPFALSVDPVSIMEELHRRYPNGAGPINLQKLSADNPDIPWKTLANNATEYFGKGSSGRN